MENELCLLKLTTKLYDILLIGFGGVVTNCFNSMLNFGQTS